MTLDASKVAKIIDLALAEDIGEGDITSNLTIPQEAKAQFVIRAREEMVVCGVDIAKQVFLTVSDQLKIQTLLADGATAQQGDDILSGQGNAQAILAAERVALNLLRQLSGVATHTKQFVDKTIGTKAKILDTRKTIPGLRYLQKYAVTIGGGQNHRYCLDDAILIKDNHISVCGGIIAALEKAKTGLQGKDMTIEIECDTLDQVAQAIEGEADIILLDNMDNDTLRQAVQMADGKIPLEASGNVNLDTVEQIAKTGVDYISAGILTHSPLSVDIGLDIDI